MPWPNGNVTGHNQAQVGLAFRLELGGQTNSQVYLLASARKVSNNPFKMLRCDSIFEVNNKTCID